MRRFTFVGKIIATIAAFTLLTTISTAANLADQPGWSATKTSHDYATLVRALMLRPRPTKSVSSRAHQPRLVLPRY